MEAQKHRRYSPDIAESNNYLFPSMSHGLGDQEFQSYENISKWVDLWISSQDEQFCRSGIRALSEKEKRCPQRRAIF